MSTIFAEKTVIAGPALSALRAQTASLASRNHVLRAWLKSFRRYRAFNAARAELMALDDRMLRDIGLDRSEITSVLLNGWEERTGRFRRLDGAS